MKGKARARKEKSKSSDERSEKAKNKAKKKSGKKTRKVLEKNIKCSTCKRTKDSSDFHEGQARCKSCSSHVRAWQRACEAQGISQKMTKLQQSDPKLYEQVMIKWIKERMKLDSVYQKVKFNIWEFCGQCAAAYRTQERNKKTHDVEGVLHRTCSKGEGWRIVRS